jgi:DNA-binding NarL/FixJ family response regulator
MLRRAVEKIAAHVFECSDGADALAAYTQQHPNVVLMDIEMPRMDGLAATRQIKALFPSACFVMVSDHDGEDIREAAFAAGASGYSSKQDLAGLETLILELRPAEETPPEHPPTRDGGQ